MLFMCVCVGGGGGRLEEKKYIKDRSNSFVRIDLYTNKKTEPRRE